MLSQPNKPRDLSDVPTGMENDPGADERIIDQTSGEVAAVPEEANPSGVEQPAAEAGTEPEDDLANALAYALDGSGIGMAGAPPAAPPVGEPQKIITEGSTGVGREDEENAGAWKW